MLVLVVGALDDVGLANFGGEPAQGGQAVVDGAARNVAFGPVGKGQLDVFGARVLRLGVVAAVVKGLHEDAQVALACLTGCVGAGPVLFLVDIVEPQTECSIAEMFFLWRIRLRHGFPRRGSRYGHTVSARCRRGWQSIRGQTDESQVLFAPGLGVSRRRPGR